MAGTRLTKQRKAILQLLCHSDKMLTAQDVYDEVYKSLPNVSLGTIYRNLDLLTNEKIIKKEIYPDGKARYRYLQPDEHNHQLICLSCGHTVPLPCCPVDSTIYDFVSKNSFHPEFHKFDIYGYCQKCIRSNSKKRYD